MSQDVIECHELAVGYCGTKVLGDISFALAKGNMAVLIGANGSGKSTLLRTITGNLKAISGDILLNDKPLSSYSKRELARCLAVVSTDRSGAGALTVEECVAIGRHPHTGPLGRLSADDKRQIDTALERVGMQDKRSRYLATLSDGERQKTMIARALAQQSSLMIFDEPTSFLDVAGRIDIIRLLKELSQSGTTILLSTHDIAPAIAAADTLLIVDRSTATITVGSTEDIISSGAINRAFASDLHFDTSKGDFVK